MKIFKQEQLYLLGIKVETYTKKCSYKSGKCVFFDSEKNCHNYLNKYFVCLLYDRPCTFHEAL